MENPIEERKRLVQSRIEKSFNDGLNLNEEIEKASHGVYADNAENRRKNRVGQEYGHAAQQKEPTGKPTGGGEQPTVEDHAGNASDKALQRAAADKNAKPEVREAAQKELEKRGGDSDKENSGNKNDVNSKSEVSVDELKETLDGIEGVSVNFTNWQPSILLKPAAKGKPSTAVKENPDLSYITIKAANKKIIK